MDYLRRQIGREMGSAHEWPVIIVGLGNLGTALANYSGFSSRGFKIVAMVDPSPKLIGKQINGVAISDLTELESLVARDGRRDRRDRHAGRGRAGGLLTVWCIRESPASSILQRRFSSSRTG